LLNWEVEQQSFDPRLLQQGVALQKHRDAVRQTVAGLTAQIAQLTIRAPFDGIVETGEEALAPGNWLPRGTRLFDVVGPGAVAGNTVKGDAFVGEDDVGRITAGDAASFVASVPEIGTLKCRVDAVDRVNLAALDEPYVASIYGGPIPAERQPGTQQLVPLHAIYQVRIGQCAGSPQLTRQIVGTAVLGGAHQSLAWRGARALLAIVEREAGA